MPRWPVPHPRAHAAAVAGLRRASGVARAGGGGGGLGGRAAPACRLPRPGYGPAGRGAAQRRARCRGLACRARCASSTSCGVRCVPTKVPTRGKEVHLRPRARAGRSAGLAQGARSRTGAGGRAPGSNRRIQYSRTPREARSENLQSRLASQVPDAVRVVHRC